VVGANEILQSDVETQYMQLRSQGNIQGTAEKVKCQILEGLLFQKLLYHQSQIDSVKVTDAQVDGEMDHRMRYSLVRQAPLKNWKSTIRNPSLRSKKKCVRSLRNS